MRLISHRGNLDGKDSKRENNPIYIEDCLKLGFDVEIDVRYIDNKFYLGHDKPEQEVSFKWLNTSGLWIHSKTIETISELAGCHNINTFFHDSDECTLTTFGWIWTYPGKLLVNKFSIAVLPETIENYDIKHAGGICSDYIIKYK